MSERIWKRVAFNDKREVTLQDLLPEQQKKVWKYEEALKIARKSRVANPKFSRYFVKESVGAVMSHQAPAGNVEYGLCQALHGEESAGAAYLSVFGDRANLGGIVLGIFASHGNPGRAAAPCGNCRDFLRDVLGEEFEIVFGAPDGGYAVVAKMNDYLFDGYRLLANPAAGDFLLIGDSANLVRKTAREGRRLESDPYSPPHPFVKESIHPERKYYACVRTGMDYFGGHDVMCEYHPTYAGESAILAAHRARDFTPIDCAVFVTDKVRDRPPDVMYRDRQHLLELNFEREALLGCELDPPVYLASVDAKSETLLGLWKTSVKEWLPMPFSPHNFGPEYNSHLKKYYEMRKNL